MKYFVAVLLLAAAVFAIEEKEPIKILRSDVMRHEAGGYSVDVEQEDGTLFSQKGRLVKGGEEGDVVVVSGSFRYMGDDGKFYTVTYTADENGFRPVGEHFPVAPIDPHHH